MKHVAGLDVGTSSTKIVVVDQSGQIVATHSASYPLLNPHPCWFEQNPNDWIHAAEKCLAAVSNLDIGAIGITGQMHGLVPLDSSFDVIRPAMLWNDQRTANELIEWEEKVGAQELREANFNAPMTGFQVPKLLWMRNSEPENFNRIQSCLLPKDYVAFKLTGRMGSDPADAAGTGLMDVKNSRWNEEHAAKLELQLEWFPPIVEHSIGEDQDGIPWFLAGGDQSANGVGTGCLDPSSRSLSLGSSAVIFSPTFEPKFHPSETLNCFNHISGGWLVMAVSLNGTVALDTFLNQYLPGIKIDELEDLARQSAPGSNGIRVYPYFGGERCPFNDPNIPPRVEGVTESTTKADLARGILEGIAFNLTLANAYVTEASGQASSFAASGGGSKNGLWLQIFADCFRRPIHRLASAEGPAFGAAIVAGVKQGFWESFEATTEFSVRSQKVFSPSQEMTSIIDEWQTGFLGEAY